MRLDVRFALYSRAHRILTLPREGGASAASDYPGRHKHGTLPRIRRARFAFSFFFYPPFPPVSLFPFLRLYGPAIMYVHTRQVHSLELGKLPGLGNTRGDFRLTHHYYADGGNTTKLMKKAQKTPRGRERERYWPCLGGSIFTYTHGAPAQSPTY